MSAGKKEIVSKIASRLFPFANLALFIFLSGFWLISFLPVEVIGCNQDTGVSCNVSGGGGGGSSDAAQRATNATQSRDPNVSLDKRFGLPSTGCCNDPFTTNDGTMLFSVVDFHNKQPGYPFKFERHYNSNRSSESRSLGEGWMHNYDQILFDDFLNSRTMRLTLESGFFVFQSDGLDLITTNVPGFYGKIDRITSCQGLNAGLLNHPNARACSATQNIFDRLYRYTDKYGEETYFARILIPLGAGNAQGDLSVFRPVFRKQIDGQTLTYVYDSYLHSKVLAKGVSCTPCFRPNPNSPPCPSPPPDETRFIYKNRLRTVSASPLVRFGWSIQFSYFDLQSNVVLPLIRYPVTEIQFYSGGFIRKVESSLGQTIEFSFPSTAGLPLKKISPTQNSPVLVNRIVPNENTNQASYSYRIDEITGDLGSVCNSNFGTGVIGANAVISSKSDPNAVRGQRNIRFEYLFNGATYVLHRQFNSNNELITGLDIVPISSNRFRGDIINPRGIERSDIYLAEAGTSRRLSSLVPDQGISFTYAYNNDMEITNLKGGQGLSEITIGYDSLGNVNRLTDHETGQIMTVRYDVLSRPTLIKDYNGTVVSG